MSKKFYKTILTLENGDFFEDYKTNNEKRFVSLTQNKGIDKEDFWGDLYYKNYKMCKDENKILVKAKNVVDKKVVITQVWDGRKSHDEFQHNINSYRFYDALYNDIDFKFYAEFITEHEIYELVKQLNQEQAILQFVNDKYIFPGMVIGDPLKHLELPRQV
jgi:hypothetical protein